jgi:hypothetical protein
MSDLESKLAEARKRLVRTFTIPQSMRTYFEGFDTCGDIAREVVAEKDAEIARLRSGLDTLGKTVGERAEVVGRLLVSSLTAPEQPRKVTDAQREAIAKLIQDTATRGQPGSGAWGLAITHKIIDILESTDEPAAK